MRHFAVSSLSASAFTYTPPTTLRAWKPICFPFFVSYQSVSGTRVGVRSPTSQSGRAARQNLPDFPPSSPSTTPNRASCNRRGYRAAARKDSDASDKRRSPSRALAGNRSSPAACPTPGCTSGSRSRAVEGQLVVVAVLGHRLPLRGHLFRRLLRSRRRRFLAQGRGHLCIGGESLDRLDREICIVCQVSREIVGAKLVLRVQPFLAHILRPFRQLRPVFFAHVPIALRPGPAPRPESADCRSPRPASGLLRYARRRHTPAHWPADTGPDRAAQREISSAAARHIQNRPHLRFKQRGIEEEKERRRRIKHVNSSDIAIREIFLGEEHGLAVKIRYQTMRRERLPVGQRRQLRDMLAPPARSRSAVSSSSYLRPRASSVRILGFGLRKHRLHGPAVALPIRPQLAVENIRSHTPRCRRAGRAGSTLCPGVTSTGNATARCAA